MKTTIYIHRPSHGLLGCPQPRGYHQLPLWPGSVLCYEFFTRKIVSFSFRALPVRSTNLSKRRLESAKYHTSVKKVFYKYNNMLLCILERKMIWMWCQKTYSYFSNRSPIQTPPWSRRRRMRNKLQMVLERERGLVIGLMFRNNVHL